MDVWYREEIPEDFHYQNSDRIPEIFVSAADRWNIQRSKAAWEKFHLKGQHGYDPASTDMHPIFLARGPDFASRPSPLPPFPNVDLYPLACHLLQLDPAPNNGSLTQVQPYLGKIPFCPKEYAAAALIVCVVAYCVILCDNFVATFHSSP